MSRLWVGAALLALIAGACGKKESGSDSAAGTGKAAMSDMPGMGQMEGMEPSSSRGGAADTAGVPVDRPAAQRLGITFTRAAARPIAADRRVVGTLTYAEPRRAYVNARVNGWVEELRADFVGKPVKKGDALFALYAPELVSAQEEYLSAKRLGDRMLMAASRQRLALWDIAQDQIDLLDETGKAQRTLLVRAPMSGEIAEKMITEGQSVREGDNLFLIADRRVLWVDLAVFETDAPMLRTGVPVELKVDALPGRTYQGRVTFIHPGVDSTTRTLTARAEVPNRDGRLRPGMFVTARLGTASTPRLTVPLTAVLPTGTRQLVFVNRGDGQFVPRDVQSGIRSDSLVEVVSGLKPGDEVIASATYLLDSESNLAAAMQGLMLQMGMGLNMGGMQMESGGDMKGMKMGESLPRAERGEKKR
ncbi:MAG: efflux RND transporter periplasmic adaptor subunit [Gemmatimonadales bacterium]